MKKTNFFSLIELLIVIVIIGIIATLTIAKFGDLTGQAEDAVTAHDAALIERQLENFRAANGCYPVGFHTGYQEMNSDAPATQLPENVQFNYKNNTSIPQNCMGLYYDSSVVGVKLSKAKIGTHTNGVGGCGISLQRAGITGVFYGDVDSTTSLFQKDESVKRYAPMNNAQLKLLHANHFFSKGTGSGNDITGDEVLIKGKPLHDYYGKPYGSYEAVTCVIPLYITSAFPWQKGDANGDVVATNVRPSLNPSQREGEFQYVCFFVCDMTPELGEKTERRPAELLGVVPVSEFTK